VRLVYYGTPALAVPPLVRLAADGRAPLLVVTRRDRPRGRGLRVEASPVRAAAEGLGLPVAAPASANATEEVARVAALYPDLLVVVAYGQLLGPALLAVPRLGALNVHFSLLPRHRGAAPIQAAILSGDRETGVTTMWMTQGLDEGPVALSRATPLGSEENAGSLGARLAELGAAVLVETLDRIERGEMLRREQDPAAATVAPKIARDAGRLSLAEDPESLARKVRAFTPDPGAFLALEGGRLQVAAARVGALVPAGPPPGTVLAVERERGIEISLPSGSLWLTRVKPSGRREMSGYDYANGARLGPGGRLPLAEGGP
jgi:methionyl-tRNA formyltransferase